jgi:hypothetical protein
LRNFPFGIGTTATDHFGRFPARHVYRCRHFAIAGDTVERSPTRSGHYSTLGGVSFHPGSLGLVAAFVIASWWLTPSPHFAAGAVVGAIGVIGTLALTGMSIAYRRRGKMGGFCLRCFPSPRPTSHP